MYQSMRGCRGWGHALTCGAGLAALGGGPRLCPMEDAGIDVGGCRGSTERAEGLGVGGGAHAAVSADSVSVAVSAESVRVDST